ncbi:SSU ribosomal protein S30P /sigma 54 modulation protein [Micromonospora sp. Llam0]|uniref:ribosome hibernation-promoting factor, HPF/YfiA family n=1 Tax=Micromonospora sp. Llam0 TaxID=2485143 RepID=UPI000F48510B|nr:ribosome-associated translation inhibitor RaiA [Micromonospora sp. Llam0]ROO62662.1 SSU ribosomal protein S30P /sigma 54 modulation protein [Micromonospora sp. Llam0]
MDIVVKGRNVEVPDHYRAHVAEKLAKVERYDHKLMRVDVELFHERNPRQSDHCQRVELTCVSRGPVIRAEACAKDFYSALDAAISKLDTRLRRAADRRRVHRGRHAPVSVAEATSGLPTAGLNGFAPLPPSQPTEEPATSVAVLDRTAQDFTDDGYDDVADEYDDQPWHIVREKEHPGDPMTVDDALFQMELVGHDFYLFLDKESGRPSVVYRRKGYDYGVMALAEPTVTA